MNKSMLYHLSTLALCGIGMLLLVIVTPAWTVTVVLVAGAAAMLIGGTGLAWLFLRWLLGTLKSPSQ